MTLPLHIARKLLQLHQQKMPSSSLKHPVTDQLLNDGILQKDHQGRGKSYVWLPSAEALQQYLANRFGINDLAAYIAILEREHSNRAELTEAASNSKSKQSRSFTGFLVASLVPIEVLLNGQAMMITPRQGQFCFICDYQHFTVPGDVTIVGIENAANFNTLPQQAYLFKLIKPIFVSRYPYSSDLLRWLQSIPNPYLHFGDIDFAGINIFLAEYYRHLGNRAKFFTPPNPGQFLLKYGNRKLYDSQQVPCLAKNHPLAASLLPLVNLLHLHKKGLEQEIFIGEKKW